MNILAIGAHHDDVEFGCFGTLTRHRQNDDKVVVAVMSNGALKHSVNDDVIRTPARSEKETEKSMGLIGVEDIIHLNYQDTAVPFSRETISDIERLVDKHNIDMVYTHWAGDTHQDHINTLDSTLSACRNVKNVLCYEQVPLPRVTTTYPVANYFVDISGVPFSKKIQASKCHVSQIEKYKKSGFDIIDGLEVMARYRGNQCGVKFAEAFNILKMSWL
tara:strand:- start:149 stop:802 length:654 start_codon:yes stop_codon:yes gene_type:complete